MKNLRVAIIGAGPGGLLLARLLYLFKIPFEIFEADADSNVRSQGGTLDLDSDMGQLALKKAGLIEEFFRLARFEDQQVKLYDKLGNLLFTNAEKTQIEARPEIDRKQLRNILIHSIPQEYIRWGYKLQTIEKLNNDSFELIFFNNYKKNFDLVVGADGTWSRVRKFLSPYLPQYTGITFLELTIKDAVQQHPSLNNFVGNGTISVHSETHSLHVQRNANDVLKVYVVVRVPKNWVSLNLDISQLEKARTKIANMFHDWASIFQELILATKDNILALPIYTLPIGHHWKNIPGLTLIGDAAHVMPPYGAGVNTALFDALEVANAITSGVNWQEAIAKAETNMFERTKPLAEFAIDGINLAASNSAQQHALTMIRLFND